MGEKSILILSIISILLSVFVVLRERKRTKVVLQQKKEKKPIFENHPLGCLLLGEDDFIKFDPTANLTGIRQDDIFSIFGSYYGKSEDKDPTHYIRNVRVEVGVECVAGIPIFRVSYFGDVYAVVDSYFFLNNRTGEPKGVFIPRQCRIQDVIKMTGWDYYWTPEKGSGRI